MGIFGDIGGAIGEALPGLLTTAGTALIQRHLAPEPGRPIYTGGGPPMALPVTMPTTVQPFPVSFERGIPATPAYEIPSEIPWGLDPSGTLAGQLFKPVKAGSRAVPWITAKNPATGAITFWEHAGRPVLFTRDFRTCRRVARIASRAARGRARRRTSRKR